MGSLGLKKSLHLLGALSQCFSLLSSIFKRTPHRSVPETSRMNITGLEENQILLNLLIFANMLMSYRWMSEKLPNLAALEQPEGSQCRGKEVNIDLLTLQ
jgi:hypothetical protein